LTSVTAGNSICAMSSALYVIKVGSTYPAIAARFGDFEDWILAGLHLAKVEARVLDAQATAQLPNPAQCAGIVVTGSHSMLTENPPWSRSVENWIPSILRAGVPFLGICYGHQLLAKAAGGETGYHPAGREFGTVPITLLPPCDNDPLFSSLPPTFPVHVTHSQSVLRLPPGAVRLAGNTHEPNHAFRLRNAWGVQFHPEYTADVMRSYIAEDASNLASEGVSVADLLAAVVETPHAARVLTNFARLIEAR
jgi:GMP synthase (glutamine-hydrolysing)